MGGFCEFGKDGGGGGGVAGEHAKGEAVWGCGMEGEDGAEFGFGVDDAAAGEAEVEGKFFG
jgi:hypothetical protein